MATLHRPSCKQRARAGPPACLPGRPSPLQLLDVQIFPRSKIMARRWLRSPRIRNTFMALPAGPAHAQQRTFSKLSGAGWLPRSRLPPRLEAPVARSAPTGSARSRPPGGDVARPGTGWGARKLRRREIRLPPSCPAPGGAPQGSPPSLLGNQSHLRGPWAGHLLPASQFPFLSRPLPHPSFSLRQGLGAQADLRLTLYPCWPQTRWPPASTS